MNHIYYVSCKERRSALGVPYSSVLRVQDSGAAGVFRFSMPNDGNYVAIPHILVVALPHLQAVQMIAPLSTVEFAKGVGVWGSEFDTSCRIHSNYPHNECQRTSGGAQLLERRTMILCGGKAQAVRRWTCLVA